jgi:diguanylate cyclase (GGDEF)-like protein
MNIARNPQIKLLLVEDNPDDRYLYKRMLGQINDIQWTLLEAETGEQGLDLCKMEQPDCILLDYILPDTDGLEFMLQLKNLPTVPPVVMLTGQGDETVAVLAIKEGATNYLVKGALTPASLKGTILDCVERKNSPKPLAKNLPIQPANQPSSPNLRKKKKAELISEILLLKEKLESSYGIDPFTGLPDRKNMLDKLTYEKCRFERNKKPFSLIMANIDDFSVPHDSRDANATHGILAQIGKFLDLNSRKQDVVSYWGGERFLLLLPETGLDGATTLIEKLCRKVEAGEICHSDRANPITMSFRIGAYDDETVDIEECIEQADACFF